MPKSEVKSGAIISYVLIVAELLVGLLFTPYLLRILGKPEFGVYNVIGAFVGMLAVLDFGVGVAIQRYIARYRALGADRREENNFLAMCAVIYGIIIAAVLAIGTGLYFFIEPMFAQNPEFTEHIGRMQFMYKIAIYTIIITLLSQGTSGILAGVEKFVFPKFIRILRIVLRVVAIVVMLNMGFLSEAIVLVDAALITLLFIAEVIYCFGVQKFRMKLYKFDKPLFKETMQYSVFIFIQAIVIQVNTRIGNLIMGRWCTKEAVADYTLAVQIYTIFANIANALATIFLPRVSRINTQPDKERHLSDLMIRVGRIQLMLLGIVLVGFLSVGREFVDLWTGSASPAVWLSTVLLMSAIFLPLVQSIGVSIIAAQNKQAFRAAVFSIMAVVNVIITVLLVRPMGAVGAAIGTSVTVFIGNFVILSIYYSKVMRLEMKRFYKETFAKILPCLVLSAAVGLATTYFLPQGNWLYFAVKVAIICVVYIALILLYGANQSEKKLLSSMVLRRSGKK